MFSEISADTWSIVLATAAGPVLAVAISMWLDGRKTAALRRHWVFATLMGLRGSSLNPEHVRALNVVQVEFHNKPKVIAAWRNFLGHLETDPSHKDWNVKHRDLLNELLIQIAKALGFNTAAIDIARGGYSPQGWFDRQRDEDKVLQAKAKVADFLMSEGFDTWLAQMKDADYRTQFQRERSTP